MHTHIIINHDIGLVLKINSECADLDLVCALDEAIVQQLCNATTGIQEA